MVFCKNCGEKLEDGTNFCPKCGNSIEVDCNKETTHSSIDNNGNEMTKAQKGGAGCLTVFIAISGLSLLIQGNIIPGVAAIAAVVALVYLQMGKINKKYAWTVMIAAFIGFVVIGAATTEDKPSTKQVTSTQKETTESERQAKQQQEEAERQAQQQKEEAERKAREQEKAAQEAREKNNKIEEVLEYARKCGNRCFSSQYSYALKDGKGYYISRYGTPSSDEDFKMYKMFEEEYMKVWNKKQEAIKKMGNM